MNLSAVRLKNYVFFKSAELDFSKKGISLILGSNKDAGPGSTNAAGKSVLLGSIPHLLFDESPSGKHGKSESEVSCDFNYNDSLYTVTAKSGKSKTIEIEKNGKSIKNRTLAYSRQIVQKLTEGVSKENFYTQVYLDSTIPHPFFSQSDKVRQDFFINLFGINSTDDMRKILLQKYRESQAAAVTFREVKEIYKEAVSNSSSEDTIKLGIKIRELQEKQTRLLSAASKKSLYEDLIRFKDANKKLVKLYSSLGETSLKRLIEETRKELDSLEEAKSNNKRLSEYEEDLASVVKKNSKTNKELEEFDIDLEKVDSFSSKFKEYKTLLKSLPSINSVAKPTKVEKVIVDKDSLITLKSNLTKELSVLRTLKKGVCPSCGTLIKNHKTVDELEEELRKATEKLSKVIQYERYLAELDIFNKLSEELIVKLADRESLERKVIKYRPYYEYSVIKSRLISLPPKVKIERKDVSNIPNLRDNLENLLALHQVYDRIEECLKAQEPDRDYSQEKLENITKELSVCSARLENQSQSKSMILGLKTRLRLLKPQAADAEVLKHLIDAFSKKGLKKFIINKYAEQLELNANKFSKLFFSEDYTFKFYFDTKLRLEVARRYGSSVKTSDICKLSGAEKRAFTLVLLMSTIVLTPANKRSNILILDEPESNLGPQALENFVSSLKVLNSLVNHIVILTPRHDLEIPNSKVFTVVKKNGVSRLKEGRLC